MDLELMQSITCKLKLTVNMSFYLITSFLLLRFETIELPSEPYIDEDGDRMLYSNLNHIHTMDLVK